MKYERVVPRDLFNEAKLLKCLGFLTMHIHDNLIHNLRFEFDTENAFEFDVELNYDSCLFVKNLRFFKIDEEGNETQEVIFQSLYNSKSNFPLEFFINSVSYVVFDRNGAYTEDFKRFFSLATLIQ